MAFHVPHHGVYDEVTKKRRPFFFSQSNRSAGQGNRGRDPPVDARRSVRGMRVPRVTAPHTRGQDRATDGRHRGPLRDNLRGELAFLMLARYPVENKRNDLNISCLLVGAPKTRMERGGG